MGNAGKWFSRGEQDPEAVRRRDEERDERTLEAVDLPPHVREFLALKSAAGV